jgi:lycopene cyclase domain-containing protein
MSYVFLELGFLAAILTLMAPVLRASWIQWRQVAVRSGVLFVLWVVVDLIAIKLRLWTFPPGGTLPVRLFGLPLEEYLVFNIHTLACFLLVLMFRADERAR